VEISTEPKPTILLNTRVSPRHNKEHVVILGVVGNNNNQTAEFEKAMGGKI